MPPPWREETQQRPGLGVVKTPVRADRDSCYVSGMTRAETIAQIAANAERLDDEQLAGIAALTEALLRPTVFSTLSHEDRAVLDAALDRLDGGEGLPGEQVFARLDGRIAAAKSRA
jgi:hypothetical protein